MDIVNHIKKHTESLQNGFESLSADQIKALKLMALGFYFKLPHWQKVIEQYTNIPIDKQKLVQEINEVSTTAYQEVMEKRTAEMDEYAEDYEELEQITIFILNAFENAVADNHITECAVSMYLDIINTLDYYENFSEDPDYWHQLLEQEVEFQSALLTELPSPIKLNMATYEERYREVEFPNL